nr:hypothetical protein [uncultured Cupriavidus sp.]
MKAAGIPDSWSERDTSSRARFPKNKTASAGYLAELNKHVVVTDGFAYATSSYETLKTRYQAYADEAGKEVERQERERAVDARVDRPPLRARSGCRLDGHLGGAVRVHPKRCSCARCWWH